MKTLEKRKRKPAQQPTGYVGIRGVLLGVKVLSIHAVQIQLRRSLARHTTYELAMDALT